MRVHIAEVERRVRSVSIRKRDKHRAIDSWVSLLFHY
jgi:hypothetical protein